MFVAHHIQTLERQLCRKLAQHAEPDRHARLSELVPRVRKLGNGNFTQHIVLKKEQICDYLILAEGMITRIAGRFGRLPTGIERLKK